MISRSKLTKRCLSCSLKNKKLNATGRILPYCVVCGKKLSVAYGRTKKCRECYLKNIVAWNKGVKGLVPWNKGVSKFKTKLEYVIHRNKIRRENRAFQTAFQKFPDRIRTLIRNQLKTYSNKKKNTKTEILLGCNIIFFKQYLENLFEYGMNWNNYGNGVNKWNIDHIIPISSFNLSLIDEQKKAFHFSNCRPMWSIDNIKKGNKIL